MKGNWFSLTGYGGIGAIAALSLYQGLLTDLRLPALILSFVLVLTNYFGMSGIRE